MKKVTLLTCCLSFVSTVFGQMFVGKDTLYGNEWIDYSKTYFKIKVAEDGIYRIPASTLLQAGIPIQNIPVSQYRLYRFGKQEPVYLSSASTLGTADFIEFYGEQNRDELDRHLFNDPATELLNPWYSMFNDTLAYYLSWETSGVPLRYEATANALTNLPAKEPFCWYIERQVFSSAHLKRHLNNEITYSWFNGEGFCNGRATDSKFETKLSKLYTAGPASSIGIRYACELGQHDQQLRINDSLVAADKFFGWKLFEYAVKSPLKNNTVRWQLRGAASANDVHYVSGWWVRYPRLPDFDNQKFARFELDASPDTKYLEVSGITKGTEPYVVYDLHNRRRITVEADGNLLKVNLGSSSQPRTIAVAGSGLQLVGRVQPVQFRDYRADKDADYIILSNKALSEPLGGLDQVAQYAAYRSSAAGGGFKVTIIDVNELYEQYAYGVRFHPLAIRNFCHAIKKQWRDPKYLFLLGKGLNYVTFRSSAAQGIFTDSLFHLPSYGNPGADLLYVMDRATISKPLMAVGRIAAKDAKDVRNYLEKVKTHERGIVQAAHTLEEKAWMKRILHIAGGRNAGEWSLLQGYTAGMARLLADSKFGADPYFINKNSSDPIQSASFSDMQRLIKSGLALWMIFGHSAPNNTEFDIGSPEAFANGPRYPVMIVLGCFTGTCFETGPTIGERFTLAPDAGAAAYIATSSYGFPDNLNTYAHKMYELMGGSGYGNSLGQLIVSTIDSVYSKNRNNVSLNALLHQMILQGDPAVKVPYQQAPDYLIDNRSFQANPNPVPLGAPYTLKFDIINIGRNVKDSIQVKIEQQLPDNSRKLLQTTLIPAPAWRSGFSASFKETNPKTAGANRFFITVDAGNRVQELPLAAESNNELLSDNGEKGAPVFFYNEETLPVYPPPYSIVTRQKPLLSANTPYKPDTPRRFLFELDTLEGFDSPALQRYHTTGNGGLLNWTPDVALVPEKVYYWRVARDSQIQNKLVWRSSSFTFIPDGPQGWNQGHYGQFVENELEKLSPDATKRRIEFTDAKNYVVIRVAFRDVQRSSGIDNGYFEGLLADYYWHGAGASENGVALMIHDPNTGRAVKNPLGGPFNPGGIDQLHFYYFKTRDSLQRVALMDFIEKLPQNTVGALFALNHIDDPLGYAPRLWAGDSISGGRNLFQVLEKLGAKKVRQLPDYKNVPSPYGFIFKKGDPAYQTVDAFVTDVDSVAEIRGDVIFKRPAGSISTPPLGPVKAWKTLQWQRAAHDNAYEQSELQVFGLNADQSDTTLLFSLKEPGEAGLESYGKFPYLYLRFWNNDSLQRTFAAPGLLRVLYDPLPEGSVAPSTQYTFYKDTLQQGDLLRASIAFANISDFVIDSFSVRLRVEGASGQPDVYQSLRPLLTGGDTVLIKTSISTDKMQGDQQLVIEVNPDKIRPEFSHTNNVFIQPFYVDKDRRNPLLDVTFDGRHILDGDLVSAKPYINIQLRDENRFLALGDTALFSVRLQTPDGKLQNIYFTDPRITFIPADAANLTRKNQASIEWRPEFDKDGRYQLQVNGRDASDNASGALDYRVNFEIINKSTLSNLLNYPNPFSTSTCFVYTMTGAETPAFFKLQIMTVSGKVVREISAAEFGPLQVGTHKSNFCWDGKDTYGDQLANGVYLYKIVAKKSDGTDFEPFADDRTTGFFKHGIGKMVLMR